MSLLIGGWTSARKYDVALREKVLQYLSQCGGIDYFCARA